MLKIAAHPSTAAQTQQPVRRPGGSTVCRWLMPRWFGRQHQSIGKARCQVDTGGQATTGQDSVL